MLDVSAAYTAAIKDKNRTDRIAGTIKLCDGETINITDDIIVNNSVTLKEQLVSGDTFEIGTFYTNQLDITVYDENFLTRSYANARITPKYEIQLADGTWESVPLGIFTVDNSLTKRKGSIHKLTAFDDSTKFDVDISAYSGGKKTVQQHIKDLAADVGIMLATTDFSSYPNYNQIVDSTVSSSVQTYRDLIEWCCALMAASARIDRHGKLEIVKLKEKTKTVDGALVYDADYTVEGYERTGTEFFDLRALTKYFSTTFDGEQYVYKNSAMITASDSVARNATMFIPENPLLQSVSDRKAAFEACADAMNIALRRVEFSFNGNPAIECFDTLCGNGGKIDVTRTIAFFPTSLVWKYRGAHKVSCAFAELTDEATASVSEVATFVAAVANKSPLSTKNKTDKRIDDVAKRANGIGDPIILTENSAKYLDYNYDVVGYYAGDTATYGQSKNSIVIQGYVATVNSNGSGCVNYGAISLTGTSTYSSVTVSALEYLRSTEIKDNDGNVIETVYYAVYHLSGIKNDGTAVENYGSAAAASNYNNWTNYLYYTTIFAPTEKYPYGSADCAVGGFYTPRGKSYTANTAAIGVGRVPFASMAEYNAAVGLTKSPLQRQLISQTVKKSENYDTPADLPQIGTSDTLYTTLNPPAICRYDSSTLKYICVGSDFSAVNEIKSDNYATDEYNVLKLPVRQLTKSPSDWVADNTVYPRGMLLVSQDLTTQTGRYISDIRVANGIDEWKMLKTISPDMSDYLLSADISDWAKADEKPSYTAGEVGAATAADITSAVNAVEIGGRNLLYDSTGNIKNGWSGTTVVNVGGGISGNSLAVSRTGYSGNARYFGLSKRHFLTDFNVGTSYTLSAWIKVRSDVVLDASGYVMARFRSADDKKLYALSLTVGADTVKDKWIYYEKTWTINDSDISKLECVALALDKNGMIEACNIKLEKGTKATDWSPAVEEDTERITSLEARIAALEAAAVSGGEV